MLIQHLDGESGDPTVSMTAEQAAQCSHHGPCDDDVAANLNDVVWHASDDQIRRYLKGYGAWDDLQAASSETLHSRMLWIAACDIREHPEMYA